MVVGRRRECADTLVDWRDGFGITYWTSGRTVDAVRLFIEQPKAHQ